MSDPPAPTPENLTLRLLVTPEDLNTHKTLFGGKLLSWMDQAGAICAHKKTGQRIVLLKVDEVLMKKPVFLVEMVDIYAEVIGTGKTSITVKLDVWRKKLKHGEEVSDWVAGGNLTYVAVDENLKPMEIAA